VRGSMFVYVYEWITSMAPPRGSFDFLILRGGIVDKFIILEDVSSDGFYVPMVCFGEVSDLGCWLCSEKGFAGS
jgi:hypothetical protein